jgi:putative DNA primase/helicase
MMGAETIARALGGIQSRNGWWSCQCPVCQGEGKLGLRDGKDGLAVNCFRDCSRTDILAELLRLGLYDPSNPDRAPELSSEELQRHREAEEADRARRIANARWLWQEETVNATGTAAHTYLSSRLILFDEMPEAIRFQHGHAKRNRPPSMVCRIDHVLFGSIGVHLTHLTYDGRKAAVDPVRQCIGACAGGAVQIGRPRPDRRLVIGEGVESAISLGLSLNAPAWAALSANGLRGLILPPEANVITIAADNDAAGKKAAQAAAKRWAAEGREVEICVPPVPGTDWNDALLRPALRRGAV